MRKIKVGQTWSVFRRKWEHKASRRNLRDWGRRGWGKQAPPPPRLLLPPQRTFFTVWSRQVREELLRPVRGAGGSWDWGWGVRRGSGPSVESASPCYTEFRELLTGWFGDMAVSAGLLC